MKAAFSSAVIQKKLANMRVLLADLEAMASTDADDLRIDRMRRHALERVLTLLVDSAVDINVHVVAARTGTSPVTYRDSFIDAAGVGLIDDELARALAPSVGMRNVLIHEYLDVDLDMVVAAVDIARAQYREYVRQVASNLVP